MKSPAKPRPKPVSKLIKPGRIQAVLRTLGSEIAQDLIPVGATLPPEHDLESRFGVGRGVVREAIKTLAAKGLVSFYLGTSRPPQWQHAVDRACMTADDCGAAWITAPTLLHGVAIAIPTVEIPALLAWCERPQVPYDGGIVPPLLERVVPVHALIPVDLFIPGCPPPAPRIRAVLQALIEGQTPEMVSAAMLKFG